MSDILDHLTDEHRKVEQMLARLKETDPGEVREKTFTKLRSALSTHMAVEERFLYPLFAEHLGEDAAADATDEHELARSGLEEAARRLEEGAFAAAIEILEAGIGHHVDEEESEQFPELRRKAADQLARMDPEELEAEVEGQEKTRDELYEEAKDAGVPGRSSMNKDELRQAVADS